MKFISHTDGSTYQPSFLIHNHHGRKKESEEDSEEGSKEDCKEGSEKDSSQGCQEARIVCCLSSDRCKKEKPRSGGIFLLPYTAYCVSVHIHVQ